MNPTVNMPSDYDREPIDILIVEDNTADLMIMQEALLDTRFPANVHTPRPHLILLDLNMPRKNGHEVLQEIKSDRLLMRIPVIILTTSQADDDISRAYAAHANCYIRKPVDFNRFCDVMRQIEAFWVETVSLPAISPTGCQAL